MFQKIEVGKFMNEYAMVISVICLIVIALTLGKIANQLAILIQLEGFKVNRMEGKDGVQNALCGHYFPNEEKEAQWRGARF